jgi:hypothetical protein
MVESILYLRVLIDAFQLIFERKVPWPERRSVFLFLPTATIVRAIPAPDHNERAAVLGSIKVRPGNDAA